MKVCIEFRTDNAAFADDDWGPECYRILCAVADELPDVAPDEGEAFVRTIQDVNGNTVGRLVVGEER